MRVKIIDPRSKKFMDAEKFVSVNENDSYWARRLKAKELEVEESKGGSSKTSTTKDEPKKTTGKGKK